MGLTWRSFSRAEKTLVVLFLLTLPLVQPRVSADGTGYYAFARSLLIDHNLQFKGDWKDLRTLPAPWQRDAQGRIVGTNYYTKTGHLANPYTVGPAILWSPFLLTVHAAVLMLNHFGFSIPADGFSLPYRAAMAAATALYGFLGVWLSFQLARRYTEQRWAFAAAIGIWFGSSLPAYMYVDTAWSHAHSAFAVALFLWYWDGTRGARTAKQWAILGFLVGFMADVYFANILFVTAMVVDEIGTYREGLRRRGHTSALMWRTLRLHLLCAACALLAFVPTLVCREVIFGNPFGVEAYSNQPWRIRPSVFWELPFSLSHGLFIITPILFPAVVGLFILRKRTPEVGNALIVAALAFYLLISIDPWWNGIYSFGNRFFVSLTPLFVLGLASTFSAFVHAWTYDRGAPVRIVVVLAVLLGWNVGLVFQWGMGWLPAGGGEIHWDEVLYNEFRVLPGELLNRVESRFAIHPPAPSAGLSAPNQ
jgi:hypothetical protein